MAYTPQTWSDGPAGATPLSAARFNWMEAGIEDADTRLDGKQSWGAPASVGARTRRFDTARSIYGATSTNLRTVRSQLGKARAGTGLFRIGLCGDSLTAGAGSTVGSNDAATRLSQHFAALGYTVGELVWVVNGGSPTDARMTLGTWAQVAANSPMATVTGTGPLAYASTAAGTVVEILSRGDSPSFTYSIDGAAAVTVAPGVAAMRLTTVTGLADTTHTVSIVGSGAFIGAIGVRNTSGVVVMNAGQSGTTTGYWLPTANYFDGIKALLGATPDVVLTELGRNDEANATGVPALEFNLNSITAEITAAGAANLLVGSHPQTGPYMTGVYNVADAKACPLLDLADRFTSAAPGLLSDGLHYNPAGQAAKAQAWADLFDTRPVTGGGAAPLDPDLVTIAGLTATTDNVIQSVAGAWASRTPSQVKATMSPSTVARTAFGHQALDVATGANNTAFGFQAGKAITTGTENTGVGHQAQQTLTGGAFNTGIGHGAQQAASTANHNVAVGYRAQFSMTSGSENVAMGSDAQVLLTTGVGNVALGRQAQNAITSGQYNVALGLQSQFNLTIGQYNLGIGLQSQFGLTSGVNNVGIGYQSQQGVTTGNDNTAIGYQSGKSITTGTKNNAIGMDAGFSDGVTASIANSVNATTIGYRAQALVNNVVVLGSRVAADRVSLCLGNYGDQSGGGVGVFALSNAATLPTTNPAGGGVLYAEAGALRWRGSAGTVTTIAVA